MQEDKLFINGKLVDLAPKTTIALSYQANNLGELENRQGTFSNIFKLPKTLNNRAIFEDLDNINSETLIPYKIASATYIQNGAEIVSEGKATIQTTDSSFNVRVNTGNTDFFSLIKPLSVGDIIGTSANHVQDFETIFNSRSNNAGFIYPLVEWEKTGEDFTNDEIFVEKLLPFIFLNDVFDLVEILTGFNHSGTYYDAIRNENIILSPKNYDRSKETIEKYNSEARNSASQVEFLGVVNSEPFIKNFVPDLDIFGFGFTNNLYTFEEGLKGYFTYKGSVKMRSQRTAPGGGSRLVGIKAQLVNANTLVVLEESTILNVLVGEDPAELYEDREIFVDFITSNYYFPTGFEMLLRFNISDVYNSEFTLYEEGAFKFNLVNEISLGGDVPMNEIFREIKVVDLYKDLMNLDCIICQTDSFTKQISFNYFDEILSNFPKARKWSSKVDTASGVKTNYSFGSYAQINNLIFTNSEDVQSGFGSKSFLIENETLESEKNVVIISASATQQEEKFLNEIYPQIKVFNSISRKFETAPNYRILKLKRKDTAQNYVYKSTIYIDNETTNIDLPFAENKLIDLDKYSAIRQILNKCKSIDLVFNIDSVDVGENNFLIPLYLNIQVNDIFLNGYFYLNKIENFKGGATKLELLRV